MTLFGGPRVARPSDADLGWLAGIIDGEGSINATKNGGPGTRSRGLVSNIQINIASSDWRVIERVKTLINQITGMHVAAYNTAAKLNRDCWIVRISRKALLRALLPSLLRHLVLKRAQGALAYAMASRCWDNNGVPEWINEYGKRIQWFNRHRLGPDGQWYLSGYERTRQSRGKPASQPEPVETVQVTPEGEETVQEDL